MGITYNGIRRHYDRDNWKNPPRIETLDNVEEFRGMVVDTWGQEERVMSDVWEWTTYAVVFNPETGKFQNVFVAQSGYQNPELTIIYKIDANDQIKEFFQAHQEGKTAGRKLQDRMERYDRNEQEKQERRHNPCIRERMVKVVKGRKIPVGTQGKVFWIGSDSFGNTKLGIATSDRKVNNKYADVQWVAASNCVPVNPFDGI